METLQPGRARQAVVIGGSMAGLITARVLSNVFDRVVIVERDELPEASVARKGVPQGRHVHNLLARADSILDRLFPDLFDDLLARGAVHLDWSADARWHHHGVWKIRSPSGVKSYLMSRPLLEWRLRTHLQAVSNIHLHTGCRAKRLLSDADGRVVTGVDVQPVHSRESASPASLRADLVVDCSGRGSQADRWLQDLGYSSVPTSVIRSDVVYATRIMRPTRPVDWKALIQVAPMPTKRSGLIFSIEENQWMVTLFGYHGQHPPAHDAGWTRFAQELPLPYLHEAIRSAEPLTPVVTHKFPFTLRRHFERLTRFPERFIVLGDAVCSFNPIYGQGMTSAALQAEVLERGLTETGPGTTGFARRVQRRIGKIVESPWQAVASEDFRHAETTGDKYPVAGLINWYTRRIHRLAGRDPVVMTKFLRVMHMQKPVRSLFGPGTVLKALTMGR